MVGRWAQFLRAYESQDRPRITRPAQRSVERHSRHSHRRQDREPRRSYARLEVSNSRRPFDTWRLRDSAGGEISDRIRRRWHRHHRPLVAVHLQSPAWAGSDGSERGSDTSQRRWNEDTDDGDDLDGFLRIPDTGTDRSGGGNIRVPRHEWPRWKRG